MSALLKLIPFETICKYLAMLLLGQKDGVVKQIQKWITIAQTSIPGGNAKLAWVKGQVLDTLKLNAGWAVDTAVAVLVGTIKRRFPALKVGDPLPKL